MLYGYKDSRHLEKFKIGKNLQIRSDSSYNLWMFKKEDNLYSYTTFGRQIHFKLRKTKDNLRRYRFHRNCLFICSWNFISFECHVIWIISNFVNQKAFLQIKITWARTILFNNQMVFDQISASSWQHPSKHLLRKFRNCVGTSTYITFDMQNIQDHMPKISMIN